MPKDDARVEAYGTVDELNCALGVARAHVLDDEIGGALGRVQADLFAIGARLATPPAREGRPVPSVPDMPVDRIGEMESWIDAAEDETGQLRTFILPAGAVGASHLHHARAVCRRAERRTVTLASRSVVDPEVVRYLNRLSDYLFAAARLENHRAGTGDTPWP